MIFELVVSFDAVAHFASDSHFLGRDIVPIWARDIFGSLQGLPDERTKRNCLPSFTNRSYVL